MLSVHTKIYIKIWVINRKVYYNKQKAYSYYELLILLLVFLDSLTSFLYHYFPLVFKKYYYYFQLGIFHIIFGIVSHYTFGLSLSISQGDLLNIRC